MSDSAFGFHREAREKFSDRNAEDCFADERGLKVGRADKTFVAGNLGSLVRRKKMRQFILREPGSLAIGPYAVVEPIRGHRDRDNVTAGQGTVTRSP